MYRIYKHSKVPHKKKEILELRATKDAKGRPMSYEKIGLEVGFTGGAIWTWVKRWENC